MRTLLSFFIMLFVCLLELPAQTESMTVMFYNTENLFDPADDPLKDDDDFTPGGDYHWTERRYWDKLDAVSKVIVAADSQTAPAIVGLCEVENDRVLTDLTGRSALAGAGYRYVMTDSPDKRGIDVALMYRRTFFQYIGHESLRVNLAPYSSSATRDILHVTGRISSGDTLDVYVCHWPSRIGGESETERLRTVAADVLRRSVDKVFSQRRKPYVIIMGDLNEGPRDAAVVKGLGAKRFSGSSDLQDRMLVTVMDGLSDGSYKYQGRWDSYDQFIVSASLLNGLGCTSMKQAMIFRHGFLLEDDNEFGGDKPLRTYSGRRYLGGFSDHLPVGVVLEY